MPREIPQSELDAICQAVKKLSGGASVDEIGSAFDVELPRRTLQRRLARLVEEGRLVSEGAGRGSRYYLPNDLAVSARTQKVMSKEHALSVLSRVKPVLEERYGVTGLALFGSTARNEAAEDSDVDILVAFDGPATSKRFFGVQFLLEDELGHAVDLISEKALRPELRPYIEREAIHV